MAGRCVDCGKPHEEGKEYKHPYRTMDLPAGKTCGDCHHVEFCNKFLGDRMAPTNTSCDWYPVRFIERPTPVAAKAAS